MLKFALLNKTKAMKKLSITLVLLISFSFITSALDIKAEQTKQNISASKKVSTAVKTYDLIGNIKSCKVKTIGEDYSFISTDVEFDQKGLLVRNQNSYYLYNQDGSFKKGYLKNQANFIVFININGLGQITKISVKNKEMIHSEEAYENNYKYDKNGFLSEFNGLFGSTSYTRNAKGLITSAKSTMDYGDSLEKSILTYTYTSFDSKGNWVKRNIKSENIIEKDGDVKPSSITNIKEERTIIYY